MDNFTSSVWQNFKPEWDKLIDLYSSFEDDIDMQQFCSFSISPNPLKRSCFVFHILIITDTYVRESLPIEKNLQYETWHFFWEADHRITRDTKKFYKNRKLLTSAAELVIKNAIANKREPPFFDRKFWIECERHFLGEKLRIDETRTFSPEIVVLSSSGKVFRKKSKIKKFLGIKLPSPVPFPSSRVYSRLCRNFHKTLVNPIIRNKMLKQIVPEPKLSIFSTLIQPAHMGWISEVDIPEYIGLHLLAPQEPVESENETLKKENNAIHKYGEFFKIVPNRISIPLFAYSIFSIIKFFINSYPSRISQHQSFKSVVKEQHKMIFMSLSGKNALSIGKAFCGVFTKNSPSERVHDGVVIINSPPKNIISFANKIMMQDASILCINPAFEKNPYEIAIKADIEFSTENCENLQDICRLILVEFINYLSTKFVNTNIDIKTSSRDLISKKFEDYYLKAAKLAQATEDEVRTNLNEFNKELHSDTLSLSTDGCFYISQSIYDEMLENHQAVIKYQRVGGYIKKFYNLFLEEAKLIITSQKQLLGEKLFFTDTSRRAFSSAGKKYYPQKYAYLYSSMLTFCEFLKDKGVPDEKVDALKKESFEILHDLMLNREKKSAPSTFMNEYLSSLIENGKIICFRTKSNKNTCGWYDAKKQHIYLPYSSYFDTILDYWKSDNTTVFPYKKSDFQKELIELNILIARKNGPNSSYFRPEHLMTISPAKDKIQRKEAVLKIDVTKLSLSNDAKKLLKDMSTTSVSRRIPKKKTKKAITTDDTLSKEENIKV